MLRKTDFLFVFPCRMRYLCNMKLTFTLHYHTAWGQRLHVDLCYLGTDGRRMRYDLPMQTQDGERWMLETSTVESRQHPVASFTYAYEVQDQDGKTLRREWDLVPRTYIFSELTHYLFADHWRDIPIPYYLYSSAYSAVEQPDEARCRLNIELPLFRKTLVLRVSAPQLREGQALAVCGSHPMLGSWNPTRFLKLNYMGSHDWIISLNTDMMTAPFEFKYIVIDAATAELKAWEEGQNRTTGDLMLNDGQTLVLYGELRFAGPQWRTAGVVTSALSVKLIDWARRTGLKVIKLVPDTRRTRRWHLSDVRNLQSLHRYASSKGVTLMGRIAIDLGRPMPLVKLYNRLQFLQQLFDAVSLDMIYPDTADLHKDYWSYLSAQRLEQIIGHTTLLVTLEQGLQLDFLQPVIRKLGIIVQQLHSKPQNIDYEFAHIDDYPLETIACTSAERPDSPSLAAWWVEDYGRTQRYYVTMLHKHGKAPRSLTPAVAEEIVARYLYSPAMMTLFSLGDLVQMQASTTGKPVSPAQLIRSAPFARKLASMISQSKR